MSSRSSYGSSYDKGASYAPRPSSTTSSTYTSSSTSSNLYAHSGYSSRNNRYGSKPQVVVSQGGQSNDPNTSTSAPNSGYYN
ncbi:hypothetical protein DM02DRAFT_653683 [Periconia macrospinosa]|uniref:Uncharacterized protein n=1 Tax=Periconia macrospinosa TaxID=97972 RepID=A0A2V1DWS2_9PLEO|nr:hypothetical protein DM02DRAFT_653683 [Periconia macrospinosa]